MDTLTNPTHYKIDWIKLGERCNPYEFNIVKYLIRYKYKNGLEDLQKALRYANLFKASDVTRSGAKVDCELIKNTCNLSEAGYRVLLHLFVNPDKLAVIWNLEVLMNNIKKTLDKEFETDSEIDGDSVILFSWIAIVKNSYGLFFYDCQNDGEYHQTTESTLTEDIRKELL